MIISSEVIFPKIGKNFPDSRKSGISRKSGFPKIKTNGANPWQGRGAQRLMPESAVLRENLVA